MGIVIFRAAKDATTCGDVWFHPGQLANYQVAVCIQVAVARHLCDTCLATHAKLSMWLCKLYIRRNVRKTISGESKVTQRSENNPLNTAKTKHSVVLQVYKWKRCRFKSLNLGSGRSTKRMASETRFFQFVGLGNLKISGRFRATSPTWSSWHSLPGRKLQEPRSTRKINRSSESSEFLPSSFSEFLPKVDQLGPSQRNSTNLTPRLASLLAILPWTRHLCRPCHIASNSQPLPAQNCTSESESSKGTDTWNWALCCHHLTGLNFLEMLYQFILRGAVVLQFVIFF